MTTKPAINNQLFMKQLVQEAEIVGLSEKESLEYIQAKSGTTISHRTLYRFKAQIRSDPERNSWLSYYAKSGFVDHYRDRLSEMLMVAVSNERADSNKR